MLSRELLINVFKTNGVYKSGYIVSGLEYFTWALYVFFLKDKKVVYANSHWQYSSSVYLARLKDLGVTAEIFELSHKNIHFITSCVHIDCVYFSMLITWIWGRGAPIERNHWCSYAETFWVVALEVVGYNIVWGQVSG